MSYMSQMENSSDVPVGEGVLGGAAGGSALEAPGPVLQGDAAALQQVAHSAGRLVRPVLAGGGVATRSPCKHTPDTPPTFCPFSDKIE